MGDLETPNRTDLLLRVLMRVLAVGLLCLRQLGLDSVQLAFFLPRHTTVGFLLFRGGWGRLFILEKCFDAML